jgi:sugar-specific transcriptional regulator TrmB
MHASETLSGLGLSRIEAEVYLALLRHGRGTGYAIAKAMGRQAPQIYNALESLAHKGAALLDDSEAKQWQAVPPSRFLRQLSQRFQADCLRAEASIAELGAPEENREGINRLRTVIQVIEHCRGLLAEAQEIVLLDCFPIPLEMLKKDLEAAASRGVSVHCITYVDMQVPGVEFVLSPAGDEILRTFPGQGVICVADATAFVSALLSRDGESVQTAIATRDPFLTGLRHEGLSTELAIDLLKHLIREGASLEELRESVVAGERISWRRTPGFRSFFLAGSEV